MTTHFKVTESRQFTLACPVRLVANGRARIVEIPWHHEVIRFENVVRARKATRVADRFLLAGDWSSVTRPPCTEF